MGKTCLRILFIAYDPYFLQDSSDKTEVAGISEAREHSDSVSRDSMSRESVSRESITDDSNNAVSVEDVTLTVVDAQDDDNAGEADIKIDYERGTPTEYIGWELPIYGPMYGLPEVDLDPLVVLADLIYFFSILVNLGQFIPWGVDLYLW